MRHAVNQFVTVVVVLTFVISSVSAEKQLEILEADGNVIAEWDIDFERKVIQFDVTARTNGFVGFGLSRSGGMDGADMIVGGLFPNGSVYFTDYHGVGDAQPVRDVRQDWKFISGFENATHTFLRFSRLLDTCDVHDIAITNDTLSMIWAMGDEDDLSYHRGSRGTIAVNILDPPYPDVDVANFKRWDLTVEQAMPNQSYTYWCTFHRSPRFKTKHHIVGFRPLLKGPLAVKHTHHFVIYKCTAPEGYTDSGVFGPFTDEPGAECYAPEEMKHRPTQSCSVFLYVWGAGGKEFMLPEHVGYPMGVERKDEFFMLEIHYDNPDLLTNVRFEAGVSVFYTSQLRQYDASMMTIGHTVVASLLIPPKSQNYMIVGHCSSECTKRSFPKSGIKIFNVLLHTHLTGRKMKLRHFRNGTELPWVSNDDSYHFNYQKNRPLREERQVLPGDHLTFECTFDTMDRNGVVTAGYSTRDEMCETFVWYYPKSVGMEGCSSFYPIELLYDKFGIEEVTWEEGLDKGSQPTILAPPSLANKTYSEAINSAVKWTPELRAELQQTLHHADHQSVCTVRRPTLPHNQQLNLQKRQPGASPSAPAGRAGGPTPETIIFTNYPTIDRLYKPDITCTEENSINGI